MLCYRWMYHSYTLASKLFLYFLIKFYLLWNCLLPLILFEILFVIACLSPVFFFLVKVYIICNNTLMQRQVFIFIIVSRPKEGMRNEYGNLVENGEGRIFRRRGQRNIEKVPLTAISTQTGLLEDSLRVVPPVPKHVGVLNLS